MSYYVILPLSTTWFHGGIQKLWCFQCLGVHGVWGCKVENGMEVWEDGVWQCVYSGWKCGKGGVLHGYRVICGVWSGKKVPLGHVRARPPECWILHGSPNWLGAWCIWVDIRIGHVRFGYPTPFNHVHVMGYEKVMRDARNSMCKVLACNLHQVPGTRRGWSKRTTYN